MLSTYNLFAFMSQLPLVEAGQLLLVIGIAFAVITLIASMYRFHQMIALEEKDLATIDACNDYFFVQVTRYLSKINRVSGGFGVIVIQFQTENDNLRAIQEKLLHLARGLIRDERDKACLFGENCVAAIIDTEEDRVENVAARLVVDLINALPSIAEISALRAGASSFPGHGLTTQTLIDTATNAMEKALFDQSASVFTAPLPDKEEEEPEIEEIGELSKEDKSSSIDRLTGVLKPEVIGSYMRKYLSEIRYKKDPATVLCAGINRIDHIIQLHGEDAADQVIAGVSGVLQRLTRESDLIGRYHRDDFLILAPCSIEQGEMIAIRLRNAVQKEVFLFEGRRIKTSISVGISAHPEHGRTLRDLFRGAYAALTIIREWNTSACLVYNPAQHDKRGVHEPIS
ncbi:MAG: GGDEF domain-containing protein [Kiritimatiellales bacterium]|nr:GGDEF domain-containing protein [Kiritimatiellota bacterium]MBL7012253.1 GGDEF domain-containing protein [Kiritimatiellales bacterium]